MNSKTMGGMKYIVYLFSLLAVALPAQAASFDCGKAASKIEKLICSDDGLSKLDDTLSKTYQQVLEQSEGKQKTTEEQRQWLNEVRNPCQDKECLEKVYQARVQKLTVAPLQKEASPQAESVIPASAGHYELVKGSGIEVCQAYKRNFESFDNSIPMACERKYDHAVKGFSSPQWKKLDFKKHFELFKKIRIYTNGLPRVQGTSLSDEDLRNYIKDLDTVPPESFRTEFYLARLDLDGDGKLANVLAMRDISCGPHPTPDTKKTSLYFLNKELSDIDYRRQDGWLGWHGNATIEFYKGKPYIEAYQPDDNWGHLLTGSGWFYVFKEETAEQMAKEFPENEVEARLKSICEFHYFPSAEKTK